MTHTINGIGTHLSGARAITQKELNAWWSSLPIKPYAAIPQFYIATESFVFFFIPIFPIKTFVHFYNGDKYYTCFYPSGEGKIYWSHVKETYSFYIFPAIVTILFLNYLLSNLITIMS